MDTSTSHTPPWKQACMSFPLANLTVTAASASTFAIFGNKYSFQGRTWLPALSVIILLSWPRNADYIVEESVALPATMTMSDNIVDCVSSATSREIGPKPRTRACGPSVQVEGEDPGFQSYERISRSHFCNCSLIASVDDSTRHCAMLWILRGLTAGKLRSGLSVHMAVSVSPQDAAHRGVES